jgi:lipopolysaccharide transport system permease protein
MKSEHPYTLVIAAGEMGSRYWTELWRCRELLVFLTWRDIVVRYKQTTFGLAWVWVRPLMTMLVFTVVFGNFAKMPSDGLPYSVFVLIAVLPWQFFSNSFSGVANSMNDNISIISKIYFPRLILPISVVIVCFVDTLIAAVILVVLMLWFGCSPNWHIVFTPLFLLLMFVFSLGSGLLLVNLSVRYHDVRYIIPFFLQFAMYISPVGFSISIVPANWRLLYDMNPLVGLIEGFRWALGGSAMSLDITAVAVTCVLSVVFIFLGIYSFRRTEATFVDLI